MELAIFLFYNNNEVLTYAQCWNGVKHYIHHYEKDINININEAIV
jgi:hypothetical protein